MVRVRRSRKDASGGDIAVAMPYTENRCSVVTASGTLPWRCAEIQVGTNWRTSLASHPKSCRSFTEQKGRAEEGLLIMMRLIKARLPDWE
jgi:hypothetical protein